MSITPASLAFALAALLAAASATHAAPAASAATEGVTKVAEVGATVRPASVTDGEDEAGTCSRIRRRLWVQGEGWIVRRVTTCR
ncbi:hypothetical protein [uncultured Methylobacterium sp.]|uniref:hypothetical protein n=1 Tax=uncultured Methylobacterium sp. TaxID=157278 RepID=UPI0035C9EBD6